MDDYWIFRQHNFTYQRLIHQEEMPHNDFLPPSCDKCHYQQERSWRAQRKVYHCILQFIDDTDQENWQCFDYCETCIESDLEPEPCLKCSYYMDHKLYKWHHFKEDGGCWKENLPKSARS